MDDPAPANTFANLDAPFDVNPNEFFHAGMVGNDVVPANDIQEVRVQVAPEPGRKAYRENPDFQSSQRFIYDALPPRSHWKNGSLRNYHTNTALMKFINQNPFNTNRATKKILEDRGDIFRRVGEHIRTLPYNPTPTPGVPVNHDFIFDMNMMALLNKAMVEISPNKKRKAMRNLVFNDSGLLRGDPVFMTWYHNCQKAFPNLNEMYQAIYNDWEI